MQSSASSFPALLLLLPLLVLLQSQVVFSSLLLSLLLHQLSALLLLKVVASPPQRRCTVHDFGLCKETAGSAVVVRRTNEHSGVRGDRHEMFGEHPTGRVNVEAEYWRRRWRRCLGVRQRTRIQK